MGLRKEHEEAITSIIVGLLAGVVIVFFMLVIAYGEPSWGVAGGTLVLVVITGWYAHSNHKHLELIKKERHSRIISEIAKKVFAPMKDNLRISRVTLERREFIRVLRPDWMIR